MYKIRTEFEFESAHKLDLTYESPCQNLHGHSYKCAVTIRSTTNELDGNGMICDFKVLKKIIKEKVENVLDHNYLNDIFDANATAEYMSKWIGDVINEGLYDLSIDARCCMVELNETSKNKAIWEED